MKKPLFLLLALVMALSACGQPVSAVTPELPGAGAPTSVVVRLLNLDAAPVVATAELPTAAPPPTATATAAVTATPTTFTAPLAAAPTTGPSVTPACTNRAEFVRHLSINDNTLLAPGAYFAKVWRIRNVGTCTWTTAYKLVWLAGDAWRTVASYPLSTETVPGATLDINITLMAPGAAGSYTGAWLLEDPQGQRFGSGPTFDQPLTLAINIKGSGNKKPEPFELPSDCG